MDTENVMFTKFEEIIKKFPSAKITEKKVIVFFFHKYSVFKFFLTVNIYFKAINTQTNRVFKRC
jgi:hypothetical protein